MDRVGKGRSLPASVAALTAVGGSLLGRLEPRPHLFNPGWPPHVRFRDAISIALGSLPGPCGLYFVCRMVKEPQTDLKLGAPLPSLLWVAQGASIAYPGAEGVEAESPEMVPRLKGAWVNERFFRALMLALGAAGYGSERRRRGA